MIMLTRNRMLALGTAGVVSLLTLVGCAAKTPEAITPTDASAPAASAPASSGFGTMAMQVADAKTAVAAGNFDQAKATMGDVENTWKIVEDDLKKTDKTAYDAIETHMDEANGALKGDSPDAAIVSEHLSMLETTISSLPQ